MLKLFALKDDQSARWVHRVHQLRQNARRMAAVGTNLLFPPRCVNCGADLPDNRDRLHLCSDCRESLGPRQWVGCPVCGAAGQLAQKCLLCGRFPLKIDMTVPLGSYYQDLRETVLRMKRPSHDPLSVAMGHLLALRRRRKLAEFHADLIVPIPMFWARRLQRGTNSPETVARRLGRVLRIPVRNRLLVRTRNTLEQKDLTPKERFRNVRGAFAVRGGRRLENARIIVVDDVLTTGATCSEVAKTLKRAGASEVLAAVIARAQGTNTT